MMMIMTAKLNPKKWIALALAAVALAVGLMLLFSRQEPDAPTAAAAASNDERVQFLTDLGWEIAASPVQTGQVKIPGREDPVFSRYNDLQKSLGYDLSGCAGKVVSRYVYAIKNYPQASDPVYATLLVYKGQIVGGDITDTSAQGLVQGLQKRSLPEQTVPPSLK